MIFKAMMAACGVMSPRHGSVATTAQNIVFPYRLQTACSDNSGTACLFLHVVLSTKFPNSMVTVLGDTVDEFDTFKDTVTSVWSGSRPMWPI